MPKLDRLNYFHHKDNTPLTPGVSGYGANSLDCGSRGYGAVGGATHFNAHISEDVTGASAVTLELLNADTEDLQTGQKVIATVTRPAAECKAGTLLSGVIPPFNKRYLGIRVNCTGTLTAGKVDTAFYSDDPGYDGDLE